MSSDHFDGEATLSTVADCEDLCATQSTESSGGFNGSELSSLPPSTLQIAETPTHTPYPSHINSASVAAPQTHLPPQSDSPAPVSYPMWLTSPATICEDFDDYTCHRSPANPSCGTSPFATCPPPFYTASPRSWPSPDASSFSLQDSALESSDNMIPYSLCVPTNGAPGASPHCADAAYMGNNLDHDSFLNDAPALSPDHQGSALSRSVSPGGPNHFDSPLSLQEDSTALMPSKDEGVSDGDDGNKVDEPYAQLIYRAFMSRERHAMTLQEIYAWFRDHTDKAKADSKGWQNSIRHNLSMNAAFVKRDRRPLPDRATMEPGEVKKSTEWILEEWAVHHGVQSTTRYRKGNSSRRAGSGASSRHGHLPSARGFSGRKGGLMASKTKAAGQRSLRHEPRRYEGIVSSALLAQHHSENHRYYSQPNLPNTQCASAGRDEPVTPPDVSAGGFLFPGDELAEPIVRGTNNGPGYYYARGSVSQPTLPSYRHPSPAQYPSQQQYPTQPQTVSQNYRLEDVTGIFNPQPPILSLTGSFDQHSRQPHAPLHHLSSVYDGFYAGHTDQSGDNMPEAPFRVVNHNLHWDDTRNNQY